MSTVIAGGLAGSALCVLLLAGGAADHLLQKTVRRSGRQQQQQSFLQTFPKLSGHVDQTVWQNLLGSGIEGRVGCACLLSKKLLHYRKCPFLDHHGRE